jgi:hypothetical protein
MVKVIVVDALSIAAVIWIYSMGQEYAPEIMGHEAMKPPMMMGLTFLAMWLAWWSYRTLIGKPALLQDDEGQG